MRADPSGPLTMGRKVWMLSHRMAAMAYSSIAMSKACMGGIANRAEAGRFGVATGVQPAGQQGKAWRGCGGAAQLTGVCCCISSGSMHSMHSMRSAHRPVVAVQRVLPPQAPQLRRAGGPQLLRKALCRSLLPHPADVS